MSREARLVATIKPTSQWPKLKRHYVGAVVTTKVQLETQDGMIFPAGCDMRVTGYYQGLKLEYIWACPECKLKRRCTIARAPLRDVELVGFETSHEKPVGCVIPEGKL